MMAQTMNSMSQENLWIKDLIKMDSSFKEWFIKSIVLLLCSLGLYCSDKDSQMQNSDSTKGIGMDDAIIERMISNGEIELISRENLTKIVKKEYSFIGKYIQSSDLDVRDVTVSFLDQIAQPWCYRWYIIALDDQVGQIRASAGKGILNLKKTGSIDQIFAAITAEHRLYPEHEVATPYLIKTIGNIGQQTDIKKLVQVVGAIKTDDLSMDDIQKALLAALTKLGDPDAIDSVDNSLLMGSSVEKMHALEIVEYTDDKKWVPKVVPLLEDISVAHSYEKGPVRIKKRVCDFALRALILIDHEKKLTLEPMGGIPYPDEDIADVKKIYGLGSEP